MTRLAICGATGRMGGALLRLAAARDDVSVSGGIARSGTRIGELPVTAIADAATLLGDVDAVIDFSTPAATAELVRQVRSVGGPGAVVIGTTGLDASVERELDALASHAAVLVAANFSIGVNLLLALTERVSSVLPADSFDIEIVEAHHRRKADAPSGTALALGAAAARGRGAPFDRLRRDGRSGATGARPRGEIGLHAVRGGGITGEHRVLFAAEQEVLELRHEALTRDVFAHGALEAARWLAGREPGRYTMQQMLRLQVE